MQENQQYFLRIFLEFLKAKHFLFLKFFDVLTKTGYFNTGFVSLRYKNTNQY